MSIHEVKEYPLGDDDIRSLLGSDIAIHSYPQLEKMSNIEECFDRKGRAIILFPNASPTMGHWCCMINKPSGIEFFDPYGEPPEEQKGGLSQSRLEQLNIERPTLTALMKASGRPVYYNTHGFQQEKADVATCGRHCAVRLLYAPYSLNRYYNIIKRSGLSPDNFVSGITYDKIGK